MFKQFTNAIVDIETLSPDSSTKEGVVITEISAMPFLFEGNKVIRGEKFEALLDVTTQIEKGLLFSTDTINWHVGNGRHAQDILTQKGELLSEAVDRFLAWARLNLTKDARVYAWGSDFDLPIIHRSYVAFTGETNSSSSFFPWRYSHYRCARTLYYELSEEQLVPRKKKHIASLDVDEELKDMIDAWNYRRIGEKLELL